MGIRTSLSLVSDTCSSREPSCGRNANPCLLWRVKVGPGRQMWWKKGITDTSSLNLIKVKLLLILAPPFDKRGITPVPAVVKTAFVSVRKTAGWMAHICVYMRYMWSIMINNNHVKILSLMVSFCCYRWFTFIRGIKILFQKHFKATQSAYLQTSQHALFELKTVLRPFFP